MMDRVLHAAQIRQDDVLERVNKADAPIVYHMTNDCYKTYTMKKTLLNIEAKWKADDNDNKEEVDSVNDEEESQPSRKKMRSSDTQRPGQSSDERAERLHCIICNHG